MIALLLAAQIIWTGPKLTPQEAADVLRQSPALSNLTDGPLTCERCDGPYFASTPPETGPSLGPWDLAAGMGPYFNRSHFLFGTLYPRHAWGDSFFRVGPINRTSLSRRGRSPSMILGAPLPNTGAGLKTRPGSTRAARAPAATATAAHGRVSTRFN